MKGVENERRNEKQSGIAKVSANNIPNPTKLEQAQCPKTERR